MPMAGLLAWLIPGLGHIYLGQRGRGLVCLVTITATFWTGVAIGGVRSTIDPHNRKLWFLAQLGTGGNAMAGYGFHRLVADNPLRKGQQYVTAQWAAVDVGTHYTGVAGLLNLLVIFDAVGRAEPSPGSRREKQRSTRGGP
jgi:hypothetical protein